MISNFIIWNIDPEIINLGGISIRYYGLLFVITFVFAPKIAKYIFQVEGRPIEDIEVGTAYIMIGTIVGARLGHVLFYDLGYFLQRPIEAFLPISLHPHFHFTGYRGLASHGAGIGLIIITYLYSNYNILLKFFPFKFSIKKQKRRGQSFLWCGDILVIFIALGGSCIRLGNFMNSEIYGKITDKPFGVVFARHIETSIKNTVPLVDNIKITKNKNALNTNEKYQPLKIDINFKKIDVKKADFKNFIDHKLTDILRGNNLLKEHLYVPGKKVKYEITTGNDNNYLVKVYALGIPRHPSVLYESFSTFLLFVILLLIWKLYWRKLKEGLMTGIASIYIFTLRFFYEFLKLGYKPFKFSEFNTAQFLSIAFFVLGLIFLFMPKKRAHGDYKG